MRKTLLILTLLLAAFVSNAQQAPDKTRILLILDCSNSMWDHWQSNAKIKVTQQVLLSFLDSISRQHDVDVALRVFGHVNKEHFTTRLEVPFGTDNFYRLQSKIKTLVPQGDCVAGEALADALSDFPATGTSRNIILIITDGMEECDAEVCEVARQIQLSGIVVQTFILGIGDAAFDHAGCAGSVFTVPDEERFAKTLYDIFRLSGKKARVVLRLLDASGMLFETEHAVAFTDQHTGIGRLNTIYNIDFRMRPDTLLLDPLVTYDMTLFTQPPQHRKDLNFDIDKVNNIDIPVVEGTLHVRYNGRHPSWQQQLPDVVVRRNGKRVAAQEINRHGQYLAGRYDIEVQTLPATIMHDIEVRGGATTELTIPLPGMLMLSKPKEITTGVIFRLADGVPEYVATLNPSTVAERLQLQPGQYEVVLHPQQTTEYNRVLARRFIIESAQSTKVSF